MTEPKLKCLRCHSPMEPGFMLDNTHGGYTQSSWIAGTPERSYWTGLKIKGQVRLPVSVYRCTRCGYLESYAPSPDAPENILLRPAQATEMTAEADQLLRASDADPDNEQK